ncbi:MAG: T-complex protein 1 subunit beta [Amphiamblys sp. WSBS2006]|nr:MAG: T-complex protein 1 subunit beta [Amphiamblys sp. WSBS2006]
MNAQSEILAKEATEEKGENARLSLFLGAIALGDNLKTTLGPKGMDKILQSVSQDKIQVTNDGATILEGIAVDNPGAKILIDLSKTQDAEVGDGTTSVCVLAAEFIREAETLISHKKIHPQTVIEGYQHAASVALAALEASAVTFSGGEEAAKAELVKIAKTVLSSKILAAKKDLFATICVNAVLRLGGSASLEAIQIIKKLGGKLSDSCLCDGLVLPKSVGVGQPKKIENAKILVANTPMDADKVKVFGATAKVDSIEKMSLIEAAEREKMREKVEKIKKHGVTCFVNRQLIYNWPEQLFADAGIMAIEHADFEGIERLALVTGGQIASTFDSPETTPLGSCALVEEIEIGDEKMVSFSGCVCEGTSTIVLRGSSEELLAEAERSIHDVLCVLVRAAGEKTVVYGGGCSEMLMARAVEREATKIPGKKSLAMFAYAKALQQIPSILASNGGYDGTELSALLRAEQNRGNETFGIDMKEARVGCVKELGIVDSFVVKKNAVATASEAAGMIIRVDDIFKAAPRKRTQE